jgi:hypothetical protein
MAFLISSGFSGDSDFCFRLNRHQAGHSRNGGYPMKKNIISFLAALTVTLAGCATAGKISGEAIRRDMDIVAEKAGNDPSWLQALKGRRIAGSGYYYIIDRNGIVVFHPQGLLVGSNMKNFWFIQQVLRKEKGCFSYIMGKAGQVHLVVFRPMGETGILCLSIPAGEVADYAAFCPIPAKAE